MAYWYALMVGPTPEACVVPRTVMARTAADAAQPTIRSPVTGQAVLLVVPSEVVRISRHRHADSQAGVRVPGPVVDAQARARPLPSLRARAPGSARAAGDAGQADAAAFPPVFRT